MFSRFSPTILDLDQGLALRELRVSAAETPKLWSGRWWVVTQYGVTVLFAICYTFNPAFVLVRKNQYDGVEEFWVDVRTTGSAEYMEKNTERESNTRTEAGEVPCPIHILPPQQLWN